MQRIAGRYDLRHRLGAGGTAEVWLAHDRRLQRDVAVKLLDRRGMRDPRAGERFAREAHAVARLSHPNIVSVYDAGTEDDRPYLVMEVVDGSTVSALIADGPLPVQDVCEIAAQVGAALGAAHRAGVVHRDIKPSNVIVMPTGMVKVLDFGIARLHDTAGATLTETATVIGTSDYMAPERVYGQAADGRSDLYSLGCLVYAMLTGAPPFRADDPVGVLYQHLHGTPRPLYEHRGDVPTGLVELVSELLSKQPADRPASAADVAARLRVLAGAGAPPMPLSTGAAGADSTTKILPRPLRPSSPRRSVRRPVILVAALLAAAALVLAFVLRPDREDPPASQDRAEPTQLVTSPAPASATQRASATDPASRVAQLRSALDRHVEAGDVDPDAAAKIRSDLARIERERLEGKPRDAADHVVELRNRLDELAREGRITTAARSGLLASTNRLAAALPPPTRDDGDDGDEHRKKDKDQDKDQDDDD